MKPLEGPNVNLRIMEQRDLPLLASWINTSEFGGEWEPLEQCSVVELEKRFGNLRAEERWFLIQKKDGSEIGNILHFPTQSCLETGFRIVPNERNKGYCTEAVKLMRAALSRNWCKVVISLIFWFGDSFEV
jgi:RimJ/RimL family protein N-acetyltransferase